MEDKKNKPSGGIFINFINFINKIIYGLAVVMFATTIFIYFGAQNTSELSLRTIGILSVIIFFASALSYIIASVILRGGGSTHILYNVLEYFLFCTADYGVFE